MLIKVSVFGSIISLLLLILSVAYPAGAFNMTNGIYRIQAGTFNAFSGKASGGGKNITFTSGQFAVGLYSGPNYKVRAGFQYIYSVIPFSFAISSTSINFNALNAGEPITRTNTLIVSNGSAFGYQVTASENHELMVLSTNQIIPDTTCDTGSCTQTTSAAWISPLTYGFGYRCDNISATDCASGFTDSTYYKQFADSSKGEIPVSVMTSSNVGKNKQSQITYKVNISPIQLAGLYQNVIMYIATPTI